MRYLRRLRQFYDLSQKEFGRLLGVPQSTYSRWEGGENEPPKDIREKLANLGVNLNWLETGEGEMLRPGIMLERVLVNGEKQLRKTVQAQGVTTGGGAPTAITGRAGSALPALEAAARIEVTPPILPSMVALAAQMVDVTISTMPLERRPADEKRWEAYATIAQFLAQDKAEGKEGRARTFLLGLKAEWAEAPATNGV